MTPKNILVPIDFSQASERALDYACALAGKLGAKVHCVNVMGAGLPQLSMTLNEAMHAEHLATLQQYAVARSPFTSIGELVVKNGDPRDVILEVIEQLHVDLVVMGTHGRRGISRMILGSVAEDVSRRSPCPVLLVRAKKGDAK
jgi:universal stress protein A